MKTALVTGGSRGIGRAICIKLGCMGYYVLVNYKSNAQEAETTLLQVKEKGGAGELLKMDVADREAVKQILGGWIAKNPDTAIEILVNNAGITGGSTLVQDTELEVWDRTMAINVRGVFLCCRAVLP